jgi:branched-chain amino acid transport system permease protein
MPMTWVRNRSGVITAAILIVLMEVIAFLQGSNAFQILVTGLALGALYAVVALGYTMVYGIIELINFAHGDVFAFGAFVSLTVMNWLAPAMVFNGSFNEGQHTVHIFGGTMHLDATWLVVWTIVVSALIAMLVCGILGVVIERVAYRPLRNAPKLAPLITAIGVSYILENALFQWKGGIIVNYPTVMPISTTVLFGAPVRNVEAVVLVAAIVLMLGLDRFVNSTTMGKAMRAVAQDAEAALMMGINVDRIISITFFIGSAIAGAGAVIYGIDQGGIGSNMGFSLGLFAFTAAVLGGIGNIRGAVVGGLLIGVIKRFVDTLGAGAGTEWADAVVFAILILVLIFRPAGLLGSQVPEKV